MDWVLLLKVRVRFKQGIHIKISYPIGSRVASINRIWLLGFLWAFLNLSISVVAVDKGLKVANFDHLSLLALIFNERVDLNGV